MTCACWRTDRREPVSTQILAVIVVPLIANVLLFLRGAS